MKTIGQRLKKLRESKKLSQMQMAELLDLKQPSINKYEHGLATPSVENFRKYADYFDVSMDYIFARTEDPKGNGCTDKPELLGESEDIQRLIEACFDPESSFYASLKQTVLQIMEESKTK